MKGDFTRSTFKQEKHYSSVRMQQGRVQLDADWNEQLDITAYRHATESADVVGLCGTPKENAGFSLQPQNDDFLISSGRCYVDGIMCENDNDVLFTEQGDFPEITQPPNEGAGFYLAYLDVWQRHITVLEDSEIREVALGGPDTATRIKTIWQVKLAKLDGQNLPADPCAQQFKEWDNIIADRDTRLAARAEPDPASSDPCIVPPGAGFRRLENQLYRVEMHTSGKIGTAKFKWSRDNGSIASAVETIEGNTITIRQPARDELKAFAAGQWVEITDEVHELQGKPGTLARLAAPTDGTSMTIDPTTVVGDNVDLTNFPLDRKPKVRRWDHVTTEAEIVTSTDWLPLEDGVQVQFDGTDEYQTGDYWLIPARTATADIEWPLDDSNNPLAQKQHGIKHHYCRLAILELNNGWNVIEDCRKPFPALTALTASDVTYDPSACPDLNQKGVKTVQEAIDQLCQMEGGGCAVTVGVGGQYGRLNEAIEDLLPNQPDICICLLPGDHELPEGLSVVNKPDGPAINLKIVGCAHGTRIKLEKNPFNFKLLSSVAIRDVEIDSGSVLNPFRIDQCGEVALTSCYLTGVTDRSVLVTIGGANRIRIEDNVIEALKKTSFRSPEDVFKSVDPELSKLFTMMNRKSFNRSAAASAQRLAKLKSAERKSLATKVQKSMRAFGNRLSLSEQPSYNNFVRNLSASKVNPNLLIASIKGIRGVTAQISSGTAMVIEDANADTIIENNEIVGVVSFYGTPSKTKLTQQDLKNLAATLKQRGATISDSIGTLQVQKNRLSRLVISEELILQIKSIVAAGKGSIENVFKSVFFTANSIGGGENQFVGQHIAMTSNSFGIVGKDVGTAVAESAVFVGNHAPNDVRLFNVTRESEKTANLTINIVDS